MRGGEARAQAHGRADDRGAVPDRVHRRHAQRGRPARAAPEPRDEPVALAQAGAQGTEGALTAPAGLDRPDRHAGAGIGGVDRDPAIARGGDEGERGRVAVDGHGAIDARDVAGGVRRFDADRAPAVGQRGAERGRALRRLPARGHGGEVARRPDRADLGAVDETPQQADADGSEAPKLSGRSSVRHPGASSGPRATTAGFPKSRTVTTEPQMLSPANGKPWSLAVLQPGGSKQATE